MTLVGQRSFEELGAHLMDVPFCVLDLETTGLSPDTDGITEIGAVRYEKGEEVGRFQTLVNPDAPIPPRITVVTGITQAMVIDAPRIGEALPSLLEFIGDAVIVGHNVRFDVSFLNAASIRLGYGRLPNRSVDTLRLAQRLVRKDLRSFKLSSLAAYFGSPVTPNHRALDDTLATAHVFWCLLERAGSVGVTHLDDLLALPTIKGARAIGKLTLTEDLPRAPGVYTFLDKAGTPIYIGKATNLRSRVRSYFGGDSRRKIDDMLRDLHSIEHRITLNEFEASVLEVRAIAEHNPHYNRRSRTPRSLHWVRLTAEGYPRLSVTRSQRGGLLNLGPFKNRHQAETVMHALWDASPIRRCSTPGRGCGFSQLGVAVCPHDGSVSQGDYREIVQQLIDAIDGDMRPLFDRLQVRMATLVDHQRFEDAALVRDRWESLRRSLTRRREWTSLQHAGRINATGADGVSAVIDHGRLLGVWEDGSQMPLLDESGMVEKQHPASITESEEAAIIWRWLTGSSMRLESASGTLATPAFALPSLVVDG
ncbi:MAG: DEDD exonuclease domain-containing protein [Actinomycetota bacterium]